MTASTAVTLVASAEVRRQRWQMVLSMLVVALVSGAVFATAAGARRTASVLDRLQAAYPAPDVWIGISDVRFAGDLERMGDLEARLSALDGVERVETSPSIFVATDLDDVFAFSTGTDASYLEYLQGAVQVIEGRLPAIDGTEEIAVNEAAADALDLEVGDVLLAPTLSVETAAGVVDGTGGEWAVDGPELRFDVVGVFRDSLDVEPVPGAIASPDSGAVIGESAAFEVGYALYGAPSNYVDQALELANEVTPSGWVYYSELETRMAPVRSAYDILVVGLLVFAAVAAIAGLVAVAQLIGRQVDQAATVAPVVRALGMDRRSIVVGLAVPSIITAAVGVALGLIAAVAVSPAFPISSARLAEPDPGVQVDWVVLLVGSLVILGMTTAWALFVASRLARDEPLAMPPDTGARWQGLRRVLPVAAGIGVGSAWFPGRARFREKPGSAIVGTVLGIAGVVAIVVFLSSLHSTTSDPARFGWGWDRQIYLNGGIPEAMVDALAADERLAGVGIAECSTALLDEALTSLCALKVLTGSLSLTYLEGRAPGTPGEVAVGRVTMSEHDLELGGAIEVTGETGITSALTVVGVVVQPDSFAPGSGLVTTPAAFSELVGIAELVPGDAGGSTGILVARYPQSADKETLDVSITSDYSFEFSGGDYPVAPDAVRQLERVRPTLVALGGFLGILGVVGLAHFLLQSTNRGRHDTAVLRAMGFVRRQTLAVVVWRALAIVVVGVALGVPIGTAIGRRVWTESIDHVGIVDTPAAPWLATTAIVLVALLGAALIAVPFGWWSTRRNPTSALRTE